MHSTACGRAKTVECGDEMWSSVGSSTFLGCMLPKKRLHREKLKKNSNIRNQSAYKPVGTESGPGAGMEASGHVGGDRRNMVTRMPRGRCLPPVTPVPDPKRGEMMKRNSAMQMSSRIKDQSRIVVFSKGGEAAMKPMSIWKRGYVGFERKVQSSVFVPLLLLLAVCGVGLHVVGLASVSLGYFRWTISCEGVITVAGDSGRANGEQVYMIGWARYEGVGPDVASESAIISVANATAGTDLGDGGVAGSSVPKQDWLAGVDTMSATFGALTALGHVLGFAFYVLMLSTAVRLIRSQFRSNRPLFRPASRASAALFMWLVGITVLGFYLATQKGFASTVIAVLNEEGFLCQGEGTVAGDFSYIATGFGCVASAATFLLMWYFGPTADHALADRFHRKASLADPGSGAYSGA